MNPKPYRTFTEFWPYYVSEHKKPATRKLHFLGTSVALILLIGSLASGSWWIIPTALVCGYLFAWIGHFFIERNKPATFRYPLYSFAGDLKMFWLICLGNMESEVNRLSESEKAKREV